MLMRKIAAPIPPRKLRLLHLLWVLAILLSLYEIERNGIYRFFIRGEKYIYANDFGGIGVSVSLPYAIERSDSGVPTGVGDVYERFRIVKLSFPFGSIVPSCDQLFGVGVYNFSKPEDPPSWRRLLFSFAFDVPNGRCESKQLFIDDLGAPETIDIQLVKIGNEGSALVERPLPNGIHLELNGTAFNPLTTLVRSQEIPTSFPFLGLHQTDIVEKFSADPSPREVRVLVSPTDDIEHELVSTLESFIDECPTAPKCGPLRVAVARIDDSRFIELFEKARIRGIDTEVIVSFRSWLGRADFRAQEPVNRLAPLEWLYANPYVPYRPEMRLAMHTKFMVLGNRTVFSGSNLYFTRYPYARQNLIEYSNPKINGMFHELFARIKSGAFVPKRVDLASGFSLMLGGEKMQRVGAMRKKVSPGVITEDGLRTTAYGAALNLIDSAKSSLTMSMTPLSDACHRFSSELCFFETLARKGKEIRSTFYENPTFFVDRERYDRLNLQFLPGNMSVNEMPEIDAYAKLLDVPVGDLKFPKLAFGVGGTVHHRLAVIDGEAIIGGSVNLAHDVTLNTVEILRSAALASSIEARMTPLDEPYYISPIRSDFVGNEMRDFARDGNCLFVYEFPTFSSKPLSPIHSYSKDAIFEALAAQYPNAAGSKASSIILPDAQDVSMLAPSGISLIEKPIAEGVLSASSYLCVVLPGNSERLIVKMAQQ